MSFLSRAGNTLGSYISATKGAITGFPKRRRLSVRQHEHLTEYNETYWDQLRGAKDEKTAETEMDELSDRFLEDQKAKVRDWFDRTQDTGTQESEETAEGRERDYDDVNQLLEGTSETTADSVQNCLMPRYMNEEDEFGQSRAWMMDRIEQLPTDQAYDDPQYRAKLTDDDVRKELLKSELRVYGIGFSSADASQLADTMNQHKQEEMPADADRPGEDQRGRQPYLTDRIHTITDRGQADDDTELINHVVASYVEDVDVFGADRDRMVDRLVDTGQYSYDDLGTTDDIDIRKKLLEESVRTAETGLPDRDIIALAVYTEELRYIGGEYDAPARMPEEAVPGKNGADKDDEQGDPKTDGGGISISSPPSTIADTSLPGPYLDNGMYTVEDEFLTTGYNRYQKVQTGKGYQYLKNGAPVSQQSYAGAAAHRLPE